MLVYQRVRGFWVDSLTKLPFGVTSAEVTINCLETILLSSKNTVFFFLNWPKESNLHNLQATYKRGPELNKKTHLLNLKPLKPRYFPVFPKKWCTLSYVFQLQFVLFFALVPFHPFLGEAQKFRGLKLLETYPGWKPSLH